jgi:hypothetical protein
MLTPVEKSEIRMTHSVPHNMSYINPEKIEALHGIFSAS